MRGYDRAKDIGGDPKTLPWFAAGNTGVDPDTSSGHTDDLRCGQLCQGEGEDHGTKKLGAMWGGVHRIAVEFGRGGSGDGAIGDASPLLGGKGGRGNISKEGRARGRKGDRAVTLSLGRLH